jgi:stage V sporulation protein S
MSTQEENKVPVVPEAPVALDAPIVKKQCGEIIDSHFQKNDIDKGSPDYGDDTEEDEGTVLRVKGDPKDIDPEERRKKVKNLAGAIMHGVRKNGEVVVRAFGPMAVYKAVKAMAIARGLVATQGYDLYCVPAYTDAKMGGETKTGIKFLCFISKN